MTETDFEVDRNKRWWDTQDDAWDRRFSNFWADPIDFFGFVAPTPEHIFQALKATTPAEADKILRAVKPGQAKRLGRKCVLREGWNDGEDVKAMRLTVRLRCAQHPDFAELLASTGDRPILELNSHRDTTWGVVRKDLDVSLFTAWGANMLGQVLMAVRAEL